MTTWKVLVVGGAGLIGGHAALRLAAAGHAVTLAGRTPPPLDTPLGALPFLRLDFTTDPPPAGFDAMVFAAGHDPRHIPKGADPDAHVTEINAVAVPRFVRAARAAGYAKVIHVGSFYPQVAPRLVETSVYVRSRRDCDEAVRALAGPDFNAISINAPFVCGAVPGLVTAYRAYVRYAEGRYPDLPDFAPPGGVNFISTASMSDAIEAALARGENGKAYLVGDENLTFQELFAAFFEAAGRPPPPVIDAEHRLLPAAILSWGRGATLFYDVDPADAALLGWRRGDVRRTIREEIVPQFRGRPR